MLKLIQNFLSTPFAQIVFNNLELSFICSLVKNCLVSCDTSQYVSFQMIPGSKFAKQNL